MLVLEFTIRHTFYTVKPVFVYNGTSKKNFKVEKFRKLLTNPINKSREMSLCLGTPAHVCRLMSLE